MDVKRDGCRGAVTLVVAATVTATGPRFRIQSQTVSEGGALRQLLGRAKRCGMLGKSEREKETEAKPGPGGRKTRPEK